MLFQRVFSYFCECLRQPLGHVICKGGVLILKSEYVVFYAKVLKHENSLLSTINTLENMLMSFLFLFLNSQVHAPFTMELFCLYRVASHLIGLFDLTKVML